MAKVDSSTSSSPDQNVVLNKSDGQYRLLGAVVLVAAGVLFCAAGLAKGVADGLQSDVVPLTR